MAVVRKVAQARLEGAVDIGNCGCWTVDNLSSETFWVSMVTGRVVNKGGVVLPAGESYNSGELNPDPFRKLYYSVRQPNAVIQVRTDEDSDNDIR